jgi:Na+/proline symporter
MCYLGLVPTLLFFMLWHGVCWGTMEGMFVGTLLGLILEDLFGTSNTQNQNSQPTGLRPR